MTEYQGPERRKGGQGRSAYEQVRILVVDDHALFRVGIRMAGKPPKIREILRWLRAPIGTVRVSDKD